MREFDLVVIGAGPGGYVAAIRAAQLGLKVACVEERATLGGTCLNVGCIPSKALLSSSEHWAELKHLAQHGISVGEAGFDLGAMMARKDKVVGDLTKGIAHLFKKNGVEWLAGRGTIPAPGKVQVGDETVAAKDILIATGSDPAGLPDVTIDEEVVLTSTGALALPKVPEHLVVIGAGVIGLELGQVWARLGAKVTVVEYLDRILPGADGEIAKTAQRLLQRQGLAFQLGRKASVQRTGDKAKVTLERRDTGAVETLEADAVLVAIGRRPRTAGLGLEALGLALDPRGFIAVDGQFRTSVPGILAIGDVVPGPMLAHKAEEDGVAAVEALAGHAHPAPDYALVPGVVYTAPEIASLGATEEVLKEAGTAHVVGKFQFIASGRARAMAATDGLVKVLGDAETGRILGAHVLGRNAGELIQELVLAMARGATLADVAATSHAHPGMGEAVKEACLAALGKPLHM
ncbi:MAG: dihydrolipoyl dehydrogenase [Albidovulum sp.]|uniref:dihydrolipoyl dehydrogenase n=1 Tax=Albidovulum sp. TaxID=1872424 RepID=UPI001321C9F3|nr:dihydrolipoyl dehydrogenase [Defluviimonas sp.]KAB2884316.1 MAG: dihydrolipoyl dehydrogenase [Defluviimonas sp.]